MDHLKLLAIARLVGLTQADIARHLGITSVQITRWAQGTRPLPPKHLNALWNLVYTAGEKFIESGKADVWPDGTPTLATLATLEGPTLSPLRQLLEMLLDELCLEVMERRGEGPLAQIQSILVALDALPRDEQELRKPGNTARLIELGRDLMLTGQQLERSTQIQTLLEDIDHANDSRQPHEPGSPRRTNALNN